MALRAAVTLLAGAGLALGLLCLLDGQCAPVAAGFAPQRAEHPEQRALRAPGSVITVCLDGGCDFDTLQAAVDAAGGGDEIRVAAGTYTGVSARAGVTQVVYISQNVTIRGGYTITNWSEPNPMSTPTTLDAQGQGRVLYLKGGISPTIEGLRITGGNAQGLEGGPSRQDVGGGVYAGGGMITISGCQAVSNTAYWGGGIYVVDGAATLMGNEVVSNTAYRGGGVYLWSGDTLLTDNTFRANSAVWGGGLYALDAEASLVSNRWVGNTAGDSGGGLCTSYSAPYFEDNLLEGNTASEFGGGAYFFRSDATVVGSTFRANTARWGGGLYQTQGALAFSGSAVISNTAASGAGGMCLDEGAFAAVMESTFISNRALASVGGGLYLLRGAQSILTNTVIADNQAARPGGGLYVWAGSARLVHTTLARNRGADSAILASHPLSPGDSATSGGPRAASGDTSGVFVRNGGEPLGYVDLIDTIFVGHEVGLYVDAGAAASLESTLWGSEGWANGTDWSGPGGIDHTADYWGDPAFVDPDAGDYHIRSSSAAIDRGVDAGAKGDIDGDPRPVPVGGGFDLGADEYTEIDLSASFKEVHPSQATVDDVLTYTIVLVNEGNVSSQDTLLFDGIPTQTTYISGSAMTSAGVLVDSSSIRWSGTLTPYQPVTITFSVTLGEPSVVQNTAVITDEKGGVTTVGALVNGKRLYLPFIRR